MTIGGDNTALVSLTAKFRSARGGAGEGRYETYLLSKSSIQTRSTTSGEVAFTLTPASHQSATEPLQLFHLSLKEFIDVKAV